MERNKVNYLSIAIARGNVLSLVNEDKSSFQPVCSPRKDVLSCTKLTLEE